MTVGWRVHVGLTTYDAKDPDTSNPPIKDVAPSGAMSDAEREARLTGLRYTRLPTTALCSPARAGAGPPSPIYLAAESARLSDWISVLLRQGPQLLQREPSAAPCRGYEDAGPHPLRAGRLTRILSALPASWTCAAQLLGARPCAHRRQPTGRRDL